MTLTYDNFHSFNSNIGFQLLVVLNEDYFSSWIWDFVVLITCKPLNAFFFFNIYYIDRSHMIK